MRLHAYYRSSTSYRVRIALNLKGLDYEIVPVDLRTDEQRGDVFRALNTFGGVPMLEVEGRTYAQSMAILDWLDERFADRPLLPADPEDRFAVRELADAIATELHAPLNLPVLQYLKREFGREQDEIDTWYRHWLARTLTPVEAKVAARGAGDFLFSAPGLFEADRQVGPAQHAQQVQDLVGRFRVGAEPLATGVPRQGSPGQAEFAQQAHVLGRKGGCDIHRRRACGDRRQMRSQPIGRRHGQSATAPIFSASRGTRALRLGASQRCSRSR